MDNTQPTPSGAGQMATSPLTRAVLEIDSYVAGLGWDRPARLFALVDTAQLRSQEPALADRIGLDEQQHAEPLGGSFTPIEQEELPAGTALDEFLATIAWPESVAGCALSVERLMLPPTAEESVPEELQREENAAELTRWVAEHPERQEVRLTVAALRGGQRESAIRLRAKDSDTEVLTGRDLVPGLAAALAATFEE
jgi:hypothetical protein